MDTSTLPAAVDEYLSANRSELVEFAETLVGYDTRNPPGRTADLVHRVGPFPDDTQVTIQPRLRKTEHLEEHLFDVRWLDAHPRIGHTLHRFVVTGHRRALTTECKDDSITVRTLKEIVSTGCGVVLHLLEVLHGLVCLFLGHWLSIALEVVGNARAARFACRLLATPPCERDDRQVGMVLTDGCQEPH